MGEGRKDGKEAVDSKKSMNDTNFLKERCEEKVGEDKIMEVEERIFP